MLAKHVEERLPKGEGAQAEQLSAQDCPCQRRSRARRRVGHSGAIDEESFHLLELSGEGAPELRPAACFFFSHTPSLPARDGLRLHVPGTLLRPPFDSLTQISDDCTACKRSEAAKSRLEIPTRSLRFADVVMTPSSLPSSRFLRAAHLPVRLDLEAPSRCHHMTCFGRRFERGGLA